MATFSRRALLAGACMSAMDAQPPSLRAVLALDRPTYRSGQPVLANFKLVNETAAPVVLTIAGFWANHSVTVTDAQQRMVARTPAGNQYQALFKPGGPRFKATTVTVAPGEAFEERPAIQMDELFQLPPGRYTMQVIYEDRTAHWSGRVESNRVHFLVEP